jgi:hypothetical protein
VSFSPDGRTLLTGSTGVHQDKIAEKKKRYPWMNRRRFAELKWWDSQTGEFKQRFEFRGEDLISVAATYSPDGKFLAATDLSFPIMMQIQSTVKLLDARTGETIFKLKDSTGFNPTLPGRYPSR